MIDCENEIYTRIAKPLREEFPGIDISGEYINKPSSFPHVSITMSDNSIVLERMDSSLTEKVSSIMFEVNVYSNKTQGKKTECKSIMKRIDDLMYSMNFTRISYTPVPNLEDSTVYRLTARYRAATDGYNFYRR